jgi:hypothetical protein
MNFKSRLAAGFVAALIGIASATNAKAHAPVVLPLHHASALAARTLFPIHSLNTNPLHSQLVTLLTRRGLSGAIRAQNSLDSALFSSGFKAGIANFPGGTLSGGYISGTGYFNGTPLDLTNYMYSGQGIVALNNSVGASGANFLTFTANVSHFVPVAPFSIDGHHLSGAVRAVITRNNNFMFGGFSAGQSSYSGKIVAGQISGATLYGSSNGVNFTADYNTILAFGKDPLNVPGVFGQPLNFTPSPSYITFANGVTKTITTGSFLFTQNTIFPHFVNPYPYLAFGSNPFNVNNVNTFVGTPISDIFFIP